jgi:hypothetical protein
MRIRKFNELFNFGTKKEVKPSFKSKFDECAFDVISFLKENGITTWDQFISGGRFDRWVIDSIIDQYCDNMDDVNEVKYKIKLQIGSKQDLQELLSDCESKEEYEKCSEIKSQLDSL